MAQTGSLGQPLLIPLNMSGSIGGQGGLAVLTLPTTNVATLPGLAATNPAGNLIKLPFTGLQGKTGKLETQQLLYYPDFIIRKPSCLLQLQPS